MKPLVLDLFSGIGGFSLGLERAGMETVAFCEFDKHAQKVLKKHWPKVPIYDDVRTLDGKQFRGSVDVVCGGFPCQDLSVAGKAAGFSGERSSLYREMLRIISECLPGYAIFENVTGLLTGESGRWFAQFLYDLAQIGYDAEWHCIPASELGAHHHRDRVWIIAYPTGGIEPISNNGGEPEGSKAASPERPERTGGRGSNQVHFSNTNSERGRSRHSGGEYAEDARQSPIGARINLGTMEIWDVEPSVGRVANGVPGRSHRLKQLGNAVVPQIPETIGRAIMDYELSLI